MQNNSLNDLGSKLLDSSKADKLSAKKSEIEKLADTQDAQKVKEIVDKDSAAITKAMKAGDISSLKGALNNILNTEEGSRLVKKINEMMK